MKTMSTLNRGKNFGLGFSSTLSMFFCIATVSFQSCKVGQTDNLRGAPGGEAVLDAPITAGGESEVSTEDQSLSLAEQAPKAASATASSGIEKKDRFGNTYRLEANGDLFRNFGNTLKCQVTNKVLSYKMSYHSADEAVAYYVRDEGAANGVLYALMDAPTYGSSQCPKSTKIKVLSKLSGNVDDSYKIVSNLKDLELGTTAVMIAVNSVGELVGWRGRAALFYNAKGIYYSDLTMNTCYGSKDKSFSSYVAFVLEKGPGRYHRLLKIKGRNTVAESKFDTLTWETVKDFKDYRSVCSTGSDSYPPPPPPPAQYNKLVRCTAKLIDFQVCDAGIGTGFINTVDLDRPTIESLLCFRGITYGFDSKSIWTALGCKGTFNVQYQKSYY